MTKNELAKMQIMFDCSRIVDSDEVYPFDDNELESLLISYWEQFPSDPYMLDPIAWHRWL